ncbi:hypothetical protein SAMN05216514_1277 [Kandleria vitulina]|nr:hypothetical protein SAMN05216514_1277 [Kandleria vitulina]
MDHLKYQLKIMRHSPIRFVIYLIYLLSVWLMGSYLYMKQPLISPMLQSIRFSYYIAVAFSLVTFYSLYRSHQQKTEEVMESTPFHHSTSLMIFMSTIILLWSLIIFFILLATVLFQYYTKDSLIFLILTFSINVLFPIIIFQMIVYLIFKITHRILGFIVYLIVIFITSPLFYSIKISVTSPLLSRIPDAFMNCFRLFYNNGQWAMNLQYGLQLEKPRIINLFLFAFLCLFLIISIRHKICKAISLITALTMIIYGTLPYSYYRLDDETLRHDLRDYGFYDQAMEQSIKKQDTNYSIASYKMNIDIDRYLQADVSMNMHAKEESDVYWLTLSHDYHVKKIVCKDMKNYKIDKDHIALYLNRKMKNTNVQIIYEGYHPKYYSNDQSIMLPGFFAWYPFAGKQQLFLEYPDMGEGYNIYNKNKSYYELHLKTRCKTVTNLDNTYKGYSDSLTLIGGKIKILSDPIIKNMLVYTSKDKNAPLETYFKDNIKKTNEIIKDVFDLDVHLDQKKIIIVSDDLGRNYSNNDYIIYDDYILTNDALLYSLSIDSTMSYYLNKNTHSSKLAKLYNFSISSLDMKAPYKSIYNELLSSCAEDEIKYKDYIKQAVKNVGEEQFIKQSVKMLIEDYSDEEIFKKMQVKTRRDWHGNI